MRPLSLRTSLTLRYTALLAVLVTGLAWGYHRVLVRQLDNQTTQALEDVTRSLHGYLSFRAGVPVLEYDRDDPETVTFIEEATRYYQVYEAGSGRMLVQSRALELLGLSYTPEEVAAFRRGLAVHEVETARGRLRVQSSLITARPGETYLLQVAEPLDRVDRAIAAFDRVLIWEIAAGLLLAAIAGHWMAGRALAPLIGLATATRAIGIANLQYRLPARGAGDELDEVTHAFNAALERLEYAVAEMRQFSAALAHELRTPLAILRGEAELALKRRTSPDELRQTLALQLDEFDRLARLITQVLTLARAEAGEIVLARAPVALAPLVAAVVEQLDAVAEARGVAIVGDESAGVTVTGDAGWLERLLLILIDNAIKFTPDGGRITVRLSAGPADATIAVADTGCGIAPEMVPHVFEPFFRADPARSRQTEGEGAGLGLALAKWIVDHHAGTIEAASTPGEGTTFTVRLPRQAGEEPLGSQVAR